MPNLIEAVVVNYNAGEYLKIAVDSLLEDGVNKVWIVNNSANDGSSDFVDRNDTRIEIIVPDKNLGYGRGANLGFGYVKSKYFLISNPDIRVERGTLEALVDELDSNSKCALVGPRILNSDGSTYPSVRSFPSMMDAAVHAVLGQVVPDNAFTRRYRMTNVDHSLSFEADWVSGAFLLVRSDVFREIGGFSPEFFMYLEDVFLCRTIARHGYTVRYCGKAIVHHSQGVTTAARPLRMVIAHHHSLWIYAKLTKLGVQRVELPLIGIGIIARLIISIILALLRSSGKKPTVDFT